MKRKISDLKAKNEQSKVKKSKELALKPAESEDEDVSEAEIEDEEEINIDECNVNTYDQEVLCKDSLEQDEKVILGSYWTKRNLLKKIILMK